jgi:hypothetical protein
MIIPILVELLIIVLDDKKIPNDNELHDELDGRLSLMSLALPSSKITDMAMADIGLHTNLIYLNLQKCEVITDQGVACLKPLIYLRSLQLSHCHISDLGVGPLRELTNITSLSFADCKDLFTVTDNGATFIKSLINLRSLQLSRCSITDDIVDCIKLLHDLTSLDISESTRLTDKGIAHLESLTNLTSLNLCWTKDISDEGLAHIKPLTNLTFLDLSYCFRITDEATTSSISSLTRLTTLKLSWDHKLTDQLLTGIQSLTNLTELNLSDCDKITDDGLVNVKSLTNLNRLNLGGCSVSATGLVHVMSLTSLSILELSESSLPASEVDPYRLTHPNLTIRTLAEG